MSDPIVEIYEMTYQDIRILDPAVLCELYFSRESTRSDRDWILEALAQGVGADRLMGSYLPILQNMSAEDWHYFVKMWGPTKAYVVRKSWNALTDEQRSAFEVDVDAALEDYGWDNPQWRNLNS